MAPVAAVSCAAARGTSALTSTTTRTAARAVSKKSKHPIVTCD
jgi:hypothetical protein